MRTQASGFNDSELYDWESEPSEERPSTFFRSTGFDPAGVAYESKSGQRGPGLVFIIAGLLVGFGIVALLFMKDYLPPV